MLSYRHAYHAGNHGDILKHIILVEIISYLTQKDKAFSVLDTHSGAGSYAIASTMAEKTKDYESGISRLWGRNDLPPELDNYLEIVRSLNGKPQLQYYPGSPWIANDLLRPQDKLHLFELHSDDYRRLEKRLGDFPGTALSNSDGFDGIKSLLPPPSRRGLIHIDPSYEVKTDYQKVVSSVEEGLKRFANGTYMIWYPLLDKPLAQRLPQKLKNTNCLKWANFQLKVEEPEGEYGMYGSGVFVINPPWQLTDTMHKVLPYLAEVLGNFSDAYAPDISDRYTIESQEKS